MKTEHVNTHELAEGDLVRAYGVVFRIRDRKVWPMEKGFDPIRQGDCITFLTDIVADESNGFFPKHWQRDYTIQGNRMAHWQRIIEA